MAIKSAYELALERMGKGGAPSAPLTDAQKKQIAEIDKVYKAKIAEVELRLKPKIAEAEGTGQVDEAGKMREELSRELTSFREKLESEKEKIRQGKRK